MKVNIMGLGTWLKKKKDDKLERRIKKENDKLTKNILKNKLNIQELEQMMKYENNIEIINETKIKINQLREESRKMAKMILKNGRLVKVENATMTDEEMQREAGEMSNMIQQEVVEAAEMDAPPEPMQTRPPVQRVQQAPPRQPQQVQQPQQVVQQVVPETEGIEVIDVGIRLSDGIGIKIPVPVIEAEAFFAEVDNAMVNGTLLNLTGKIVNAKNILFYEIIQHQE